MRKVMIAVLFISVCATSSYAVDQAEGFWKSVDEQGKVTAYWKFWVDSDELKGTIVKIPDGKGDESCTECADDTAQWKGKPVVGTVWIWGFKKDGDKWAKGKILDSGKGKLYWASVKVIEGGSAAEVRGSIDRWGLAGRTQVWKRLSDTEVSSLNGKKK